jgi:large subunit ribosomal protein L31e
MAEKKSEKKVEKTENTYNIPLRKRVRIVPRYKKTNKAVKTVKEFVAKHMRVTNRDLNLIKIDRYLNDFLWQRGIKNPPHHVSVKAIKEGDFVRVELLKMPLNLENKKKRLDKRLALAQTKKKPAIKKEESKENPIPEEEVERKEKKAAVKEEGKALEKQEHKQNKNTTKLNAKQPKHPVRQALAK